VIFGPSLGPVASKGVWQGSLPQRKIGSVGSLPRGFETRSWQPYIFWEGCKASAVPSTVAAITLGGMTGCLAGVYTGRVLTKMTHQRHWLCTAAMVLMPGHRAGRPVIR
jgi:hypothetical protein